MTGTFKAVSDKAGASAFEKTGNTINLIPRATLDALIAAVKEAKTHVHVDPTEVPVNVTVEPAIPPHVDIINEVETPTVTVQNVTHFGVKHIYIAVILHTILTIALGIGAYVSISKLNKYIDPGHRSTERSR